MNEPSALALGPNAHYFTTTLDGLKVSMTEFGKYVAGISFLTSYCISGSRRKHLSLEGAES